MSLTDSNISSYTNTPSSNNIHPPMQNLRQCSGVLTIPGFGLENGMILANKYIIHNEIGRGKFGIVYKGEHFKHKTPVAIKTEPVSSEYNTIKYETTILNYLFSNGCRSIPSVLWYGIYEDYKCLTMDYYDQTVSQYLFSVRSKYSGSPDYLIQIMKLITNMVAIIGQIHKHKIIHRDIKPENFMLKDGNLYLIDFGIASAVDNLEEINKEPTRETVIGSPKYISYFIHQGYEPTYRDDLISIGYCFFYFIMGKLPWCNVRTPELGTSVGVRRLSGDNLLSKGNSNTTISISENHAPIYTEIHILHEKNQHRKKWKSWTSIEKLLGMLMEKHIPIYTPKCKKIFENIFEYFSLCYNLQFEETPFYDELCKVLQDQ